MYTENSLYSTYPAMGSSAIKTGVLVLINTLLSLLSKFIVWISFCFIVVQNKRRPIQSIAISRGKTFAANIILPEPSIFARHM